MKRNSRKKEKLHSKQRIDIRELATQEVATTATVVGVSMVIHMAVWDLMDITLQRKIRSPIHIILEVQEINIQIILVVEANMIHIQGQVDYLRN